MRLKLLKFAFIIFFRCGYVLKPECMRSPDYDPAEKNQSLNPYAFELTVEVIY